MLKRLRQFFERDLPFITESLTVLRGQNTHQRTDVALMRKLLGSIHSAGTPLADMKDDERKAFVANIAIAYPHVLAVIVEMIEEQKTEGYTLEANEMFVKGTMNGLFLIQERLAGLHAEHEENTTPAPKPGKDFDEHAPLPQLLERMSRATGQPNQSP